MSHVIRRLRDRWKEDRKDEYDVDIYGTDKDCCSSQVIVSLWTGSSYEMTVPRRYRVQVMDTSVGQCLLLSHHHEPDWDMVEA